VSTEVLGRTETSAVKDVGGSLSPILAVTLVGVFNPNPLSRQPPYLS